MQRMTGLDASFLYLETAEQMMVINGVVHLDVSTIEEGYSFERLRSGLARRVKAIPPFRRKVHDSRWNLGHPAWVEDYDFDIGNHVRRIELGPGGAEDELLATCGRLASTPLDPSLPLWQVWIIERGGPDAPTVTAFCRVHHSLIDGILAAELLATLAATDASTPAPYSTTLSLIVSPSMLSAAAFARPAAAFASPALASAPCAASSASAAFASASWRR